MTDKLPMIYACLWRAHETDDTFNNEAFTSRIPRLMDWLRDLHAKGVLVGCGGGGYENHAGGLTLIKAKTATEAEEYSSGSPMNEIGSTEIFEWHVYYADLNVPRDFNALTDSSAQGSINV